MHSVNDDHEDGWITRRKLILIMIAVFVLVLPLSRLLKSRDSLTAFVDTLLPQDEFGPAASSTGAVEQLMNTFSGSVIRQAELMLLIAWLNIDARGSFANASESARHQVVESIDQLPATTIRWRIYRRARASVMRHYFGSAERCTQMGLPGAPQPEGYPDAHLPWRVK
jgi:hypothetical protein